MKQSGRYFDSKRTVYFAVLSALTVVLGVLGFYIKFVTNLNLTLIPIVLGALILGWRGGFVLGFISGLLTFVSGVFGFDGFTGYLLMHSPFITFLTCIVKTALAGLVSGFVFGCIKNKKLSTFVASGLVPIINTAIFILGALLMQNSILGYLVEIAKFDIVYSAAYYIFFTIVGTNFFIELAIGLLCAPAIYTVIRAIDKV